MNDAAVVAGRFELPGPVSSIDEHHTGHINNGYLVSAGGQRFLLQRLNPTVFLDPDAVMANVVAVTAHFRAKREPTLTLVPTHEGTTSWRDEHGGAWRMYDYIEGVRPAHVSSAADAALVGRCFGRFHRLLADLDPARLGVSLPDFHDPARRLRALHAAAAEDPCGRAPAVADEIEALTRLSDLAADGRALGEAPVRVVHNDAKAANVLVDDEGARPPVVVDLDTVMPGSVLWDVGDMVRSSTGSVAEDTADVHFDLDYYRALVDAYLAEAGTLLTADERDAIPAAGPVVTFEQAVRFLTDHVVGDVYFRVARPGHNLERARNQLRLLPSMLAGLGQDGRR